MKGKLPKSIIKKYGITKKAWQVYRGKKSSTSRAKPKTKRKKYSIKSKKVYKVAKKQKQNNGFKLPAGVMGMLSSVAYGYGRDKLSDALSNTSIVKKLPVTEFTDEAVMLGANWGLRKLGIGKMPIVSSLLRAQKSIELGRIGETLSDMQQNKVSDGVVKTSGRLF